METHILDRALKVLAGGPGTFSKHIFRYPQGIGPSALKCGDGCYVIGDDGKKYLDTVSALGALFLGYGHATVQEAIIQQLTAGTSFSMLHPLEVEVAELLCTVLPGMDMCRFMKNGSDATNAAIRMARAVTGKRHVITCGYAGANYDWYGITTPQNAGILPNVAPYSHQIPWGDFSSIPRHVYDDLAAVITEVPSLPWTGLTHGAENECATLAMYRNIAHAHGAVFILDEVITMLRYGLGGAQAYYHIQADLVTGGKALANGLPLAVLAGKRELMEYFNSGTIFCSYTFAGETIALAAAKAVIETLRHTDALANLQHQGQALGDGLQALFREYDLPVRLLGNYARLAVRWQDVHGTATALELRTLWLAEMARRGILAGTGVIFPMACWQEDETQLMLTAAAEVCDLMAQALAVRRVQEALPCPVIQDVLAVRA